MSTDNIIQFPPVKQSSDMPVHGRVERFKLPHSMLPAYAPNDPLVFDLNDINLEADGLYYHMQPGMVTCHLKLNDGTIFVASSVLSTGAASIEAYAKVLAQIATYLAAIEISL